MKRLFTVVAGHALCGWLLAMTPGAWADEALTLDEAVTRAVERQPLLQSLDAAAAAAREAAVAEGQLPDPKLKLGVQNLPATGSNAFRLNREDMTMATVGVMQEVIPLQKREASARRMEAEAGQLHAEQVALARSIQRDVALAWLDVYEAQRKSELYRRMADEMAAERTVAAARISSGGAATADVLRLDTLLAMTNDKRLAAQRDERKARALLARWIGDAATWSLPQALPAIALAAKRDQAAGELERHPALENARQEENVAQSEAESAKLERQQNWSWEVMYGKRQGDRSDMVTLQVALDLPWDRANRQDRRTAGKLALVEKAHNLTEDRRRILQAEADSAWADWDSIEAREAEHQKRLIPATDARLDLAQAGYAAGRQPLAEVWEARRAVVEVELEHWAILIDRQRAAVRLGYLLNGNGLPVASGSAP